jgi:drug/metabolite transporter (DMT)-like permease
VGIAALVLVLLVHASGYRMPSDVATWRRFFLMGALNNLLPFSLIFWGQTQLTGGMAAILNATTPLFTVVLAHVLFTDERITMNRVAGLLCGLAGVIAIVGPEALGGLGVHAIAELAVLGAAISYAFAGIFGRRFAGLPPQVTAAGQVTASAIMVLPVALVVDRPWTLPAPALIAWSALFGLALLSTALAYVIYFRLLTAAGATNLLLVTLLIPVSAILLGALVLGERVEVLQLAGMALIALGLVAIDGRVVAFVGKRLRIRQPAG